MHLWKESNLDRSTGESSLFPFRRQFQGLFLLFRSKWQIMTVGEEPPVVHKLSELWIQGWPCDRKQVHNSSLFRVFNGWSCDIFRIFLGQFEWLTFEGCSCVASPQVRQRWDALAQGPQDLEVFLQVMGVLLEIVHFGLGFYMILPLWTTH